eukprot:CCRYP_018448-RA/>CCRYP_018448-RA protein AED:0.00 eAED:0.00 QI:269/1/1/1/0/0/2/56/96
MGVEHLNKSSPSLLFANHVGERCHMKKCTSFCPVFSVPSSNGQNIRDINADKVYLLYLRVICDRIGWIWLRATTSNLQTTRSCFPSPPSSHATVAH